MFDLMQTPDAPVLNPWRDPGLWLIGQPEFIWRSMAHTVIESFAASARQEANDRIDHQIAEVKKHRQFRKAVEYNCVPVLLNDAEVSGTGITVGGQPLHSRGAVQGGTAPIDEMTACRIGNAGYSIPVLEEAIAPVLDFALPCRTFDHHEFFNETLARLCVLDGMAFQGRILIHCADRDAARQSAARTLVEALFPEFAGRVEFIGTTEDYEFVLSAYDLAEGHFMRPWPADPLADLAPSDKVWRGLDHTPQSKEMLRCNTVGKALFSLRARALAAAEGRNTGDLPKRIYVRRPGRQGGDGQWQGEGLLVEYLGLLGFEAADFEALEPLDRIALMANAEMILSLGGSALGHMLFANPAAFVIDLEVEDTLAGTGAYWPVANAAQCRYLRYVLGSGPQDPVTLGQQAVARILPLIVTLLGQYPDLSRGGSLLKLAQDVVQVGAYDCAVALLEHHRERVERSADLCLLMAECFRQLGTPRAELVALDQAYKADPSRFHTLIRIILCARKCDRPQVIRWALSRLKLDFPDRHARFIDSHAWVRDVG